VVASPIRSDPSSALATTEQGLSVKGSLGYELYCQAIRSYELAEYALPWWIGDLLNYGIEHFGDDAWAPVMERVGRRTAKNYADVCLAFPRGQRVPGANLGKHATVMALLSVDRDTAYDLLHQTVDRKWNRYQLREHVKRELARIKAILDTTEAAELCGEDPPEEVVKLARAAGQPSVSTYVKQARRRTDRGDERDSWGRKVIESPHRTVCPTCCCISYEETPTDD
jgi:hypothetical protein